MEFKFSVNLTDKDYLEYNKFWMLRSPYGKKQLRLFRFIIGAIIIVFSLISLISGGFSLDAFIGIIPLLILFVVFQALLKPLLKFSLKAQVKTLKKSGKMGYSPSATIEFWDDCFTEITPDNKTEQKYSAVERVSVVDGKVIYIHINNVLSYILPIISFESKAQYGSFLEFVKSKGIDIDVY